MLRDMSFRHSRVTLDDIGACPGIRRLGEQLQPRFVITAAHALHTHEKYRRTHDARDFVGADEKRGVLIEKARPVLFLVPRLRLVCNPVSYTHLTLRRIEK